MVVEDNERLRALLVKQLKDLGYRVSEAGDAKAAIEVIAAEPDIDMLLTDIILPGGKNGRELVHLRFSGSGLRRQRRAAFGRGAVEQAVPTRRTGAPAARNLGRLALFRWRAAPPVFGWRPTIHRANTRHHRYRLYKYLG
jgi:hypothetical protein